MSIFSKRVFPAKFLVLNLKLQRHTKMAIFMAVPSINQIHDQERILWLQSDDTKIFRTNKHQNK